MAENEAPEQLLVEDQDNQPQEEAVEETEKEEKPDEERSEKEPQEVVPDLTLEEPTGNTETKQEEKKKKKKNKGKAGGDTVESPKKEKGKKKGKKAKKEVVEPEKPAEETEQKEDKEAPEKEEKEALQKEEKGAPQNEEKEAPQNEVSDKQEVEKRQNEEPAEKKQEPSSKKSKKGKEKKVRINKNVQLQIEGESKDAASPSKHPKKAKSKKSPKKHKSKETTTEETGEVPEKDKKKKRDKEHAEDFETTEEPKKKKSIKVIEPEDEESQEISIERKRRKSKVRRSTLKSQHQPGLTELMARLSIHNSQMAGLRKSLLVVPVDDDLSDFSLSEESEESIEEEIIEKEIPTKKKKRKDKKKKSKRKSEPDKTPEEPEAVGEKPEPLKKKKKKRKKEEEPSEPPPPPEDDVLAEIARMKLLASGEVTEPETVETEPEPKKKKKKKKKGPKKKLSKKEKARLAAEQAEKAKQAAEEEAALAAERERIRLEEEKKEAILKEKRETHEQQIRMEQLEAALEIFQTLLEANRQLKAAAQAQSEWEIYVNCERLPNPSKCDQMNTFLHLWENMIEETSMEEAARRTKDVLELLDNLDDLIDTADGKNQLLLDNWKWVRLLFREQQAKSLDIATYKLLRNIEVNLNRIDIPTADYQFQDENLVLCLWLRIQLPVPLPNPRRPAKPCIEVKFPQMKMEVLFPLSIDGEKTAVRALYVKYDHLSDLSDSYEKPPIPYDYDIDLYEAMKTEWREKLLYKFRNRVRKAPEVQENGEILEPEPDPVFGPEDDIPIVPYKKLEPTPSEYVITREDELYNGTRTNLLQVVPDDIINLRKYTIIGGVYSLHLIHQPPQPQDFVTLEMNLTPLYLPKELEFVDLYLPYDPPAPPIPGLRRTPEEIEEEMKKSEEELERLILVTLTWPEHVIFLELPMVCYWDAERKVWSKKEVHDLKHNEEKGQLTFRTRMGGTFALAAYRYANLPYQAWEMRPEANGTVSLQITAAILMVEFNVKGNEIALAQLQNSPNNALQDITGVYFPLPKLIRMLQNAGVDVFPAFDAFCYVENTCEKHWPMEKRLYFNLAQLSTCFNFAWSRWNMAAGRRSIILQMREYNVEKTKQKTHSMLHVTPLHALYVDCTEVSQTFSEEGIEGMKFYPDLYHLMRGTCSLAVRNKVLKAPSELIVALYELLVVTRVVSFS